MSGAVSTLYRMRDTLSLADARRVAIRAQGFGLPRPSVVTARHLRREIVRMATLQIDSVNVFARSHYVPLFSRLGPYDPALLDEMLFARRAHYLEYWAHQASFIASSDWPLFAFRARQHRDRHVRSGATAPSAATLDRVRGELRTRGPLRPAELETEADRSRGGPWWDWGEVKQALEHLWLTGEVAIAERRGFERVYGLVEQVVPAHLHEAGVREEEALRELVSRAARASGIATISDLDDYWRFRDQRAVARAVQELEDDQVLVPTRVEGWSRKAWLHRDAVVPRRVEAAALLTPFDPLVWFRDRAERLFDFSYRIEIYTPAPKRRYGYYSLPVLLDDRIAGRIDLKADRAASVLRVQSAWWERGAASADAAPRIAGLLREAAQWQGLEQISVSSWGDATDDLAAALGGAARHEAGPAPALVRV